MSSTFPISNGMNYLGIDYGSKRVGLAISDPSGSLAFPLTVLENSDNLINEISKICQEKEIDAIVVGESKDYSLNENEIMKEVKPFVKKLEETTKLPVHMHPEFMTSVEAERLQGRNEMHDASAAALILKSYLETSKNSK